MLLQNILLGNIIYMAVIILESFQTRQIERPDTTYKSVLAHGKKVTKVHLCMFISKIPDGISSALLSGNYSSFEEEVPVVLCRCQGGIWGRSSVDQSHRRSLIKLALSSDAGSAISL